MVLCERGIDHSKTQHEARDKYDWVIGVGRCCLRIVRRREIQQAHQKQGGRKGAYDADHLLAEGT